MTHINHNKLNFNIKLEKLSKAYNFTVDQLWVDMGYKSHHNNLYRQSKHRIIIPTFWLVKMIKVLSVNYKVNSDDIVTLVDTLNENI